MIPPKSGVSGIIDDRAPQVNPSPDRCSSHLGVVTPSGADSTTDREISVRALDPLSNQLLMTSPCRDIARVCLVICWILHENIDGSVQGDE